LLPNTG